MQFVSHSKIIWDDKYSIFRVWLVQMKNHRQKKSKDIFSLNIVLDLLIKNSDSNNIH